MRYLSALCAGALVAACCSSASAQLVFGTTTTATTNGSCFYLDVNTNTVSTLWNSATNKKVNGLAADPANGRLYANDAARLNFWNYGNVGTTPTLIAGMYRTNGTTFSATGVDGLTFANGTLYGVTSFASSTFQRGIYSINTVPDASSRCIMTPVWTDNSGILSTGGLEFNPADNLFYFTQSADNTATGGTWTPGIFTVDAFGSGTVTKIMSFPAGHTHVDGLAIGGGKLWMTEQDPTNSRINIIPYDFATQTIGTILTVPLTDATQRASGAAWAPGAFPTPGAAGLFGIAGAGLLRRRRTA